MAYSYTTRDGQRVEVTVAAAFDKMAADFRAATGCSLHVTSGTRTRAEQQRLYDGWIRRLPGFNLAAPPGQSNHEESGPRGPRALDLRDSGNDAGVTVIGSKRSNWLAANCNRSGFTPAGHSFNPREGWHYEYTGAIGGGGGAVSGNWPARARYGEAWVRSIQTKANRLGASLAVDGKDGPATQKWVRSFQASNGLEPDGIAGPDTNAKMDAVLAGNAKLVVDGQLGPQTVQRMQKAFGVAQDGDWGPATTRAIQKHLGVPQDGELGPITIRALQRALKVTADGEIGPETVKALQTWLNRGGRLVPVPESPAAPVLQGRNATSRPTADIQRLVGAKVDGAWGPETTAKVAEWQAKHGLEVDGIWGPKSDAVGFPNTPLPTAPKAVRRKATYPGASEGYTAPLTSDRVKGDRITRLIVHHCGATSDQLAYFLTKNERSSCPTWYVRTSGEVIETIAPAKRPSATGSANTGSVAVETQNTSGGPAWGISDASHEAIARIAAWLSQQTSIDGVPVEFTIDRESIIGHSEAGFATACPGPSMDLDRIVARARELVAAEPTPAPDDTVAVDRGWLQSVLDRIKQLLGIA